MSHHRFSILALLLSLALPCCLSPQALAAEPASNQPRQTLSDLLKEVLSNNPLLKADEAGWTASRQQARQAGVLEDPMVMARLQNLLIRDPLNFNRDSTSAKVIGLSQKLPFFGKLALAREAADQEAEAARWGLAERKLELAGMLRETWPQLLMVDRSITLVEQNIGALNDLVRTGEARYGAGRGEIQEVLEAQIERTKMDEMRISLQRQRRSLVATLNSLRFRPAGTPIIPAETLNLTPLGMSPEAMEQLALSRRPSLRALSAREEAGRARHRQAEREFFPDFTISLEYMQRDSSEMDRDGFDMYSAAVSFNLPLQHDRRQAMSAGAEAELLRTKAEQEALQNQIRLNLADGLAKLEGARQRAELYSRGLLPQADHALAAALAAYRSGRGELKTVLDKQMAIFTFQRQYLEAVADHQMELAKLMTLIGDEL